MSSAFVTGFFPIRAGANIGCSPTCSLGTNKVKRAIGSCRKVSTVRCAASSTSDVRVKGDSDGIRVNKCFKSFASRRESDAFVENGRVRINGDIVGPGTRVFPGDRVELDGKIVGWERLNVNVQTDSFIYLKYWKHMGIICTTDDSVESNIISQIPRSFQERDRIFPIGRLDETSTGLILLTSDGRLPNSILGAGKGCLKEYLVTADMYMSDEDLQRLREGLVISTVAQRDNYVRKRLTAPTLPCEVERRSGFDIVIRLQEGRNRQIRKMLGALGYTTRAIHRTRFMGITLDGLSGPGDAKALTADEMALIEAKLK